MNHGIKPKGVIVGLGTSDFSRKPIGTARELAVAAILNAIRDSGLKHSDIDGLLINRSPLAPRSALPLRIQEDLQFSQLKLLTSIDGEGSSVIQMLQYAVMAIQNGLVKNVVCVFSDDPISPSISAGQAFSAPIDITGIDGWENQCGLYGAVGAYGLAAKEYFGYYGIDPNRLVDVVLSDRAWAQLNPQAFLRTPLSRDEYFSSPWIAEPFRIMDCAYPVNGAVAFIVTSAESEIHTASPPVFVHGYSQGHAPFNGFGQDDIPVSGASIAAKNLYSSIGISPTDITCCQFYEAFSFTTLFALEEYGLCQPGEAANFVESGNIQPGGKLPCNTGGGHLAGFYLQGATPIAEAIMQARRQAGERQVPDTSFILVTGNGGRFDYHSAAILSDQKYL